MDAVAKANSRFKGRLSENLDILFALGVVGIVTVMLLPVPTVMLDLLLAFSITSAIMILMTTLFIQKPLDLSSFPTILLISAVMRLSLNIASTRLILSKGHTGPQAAGKVIQAFGGFVMEGSLVIGIIIFAILTIVNFVVITKGSGRIAEVAARFSLDAVPGKQMAIDADLSAGLINEEEAKRRRKELESESTFFGAMDGANKFVRGDAIAGLLITFINFIAGIIIGVVQRNLTFAEALETYTILTIGDGLVSQIPALIVSLSAGIIVSKSGVSGSAEKAVFGQLGKYPKALTISGSLMLMMALVPGVPTLPFAILGLLIISLSFVAKQAIQTSEQKEQLAGEKQAGSTKPKGDNYSGAGLEDDAAGEDQKEQSLSEILKIENIRLELGYNLLPLLNYEQGSRLPDQIKALRKQMAKDLGFILPSIRIQDNLLLENNEYKILIKEIECGSGEVRANKLLVMDPRGEKIPLPGENTTEPAFGVPAMWIDESHREEAIMKGLTVIEPPTVITTHLTEIVKENIAELLSYSETQKLLREIDESHQKLVGDLIPTQISVSAIQQILQNLLEERVSIRDLASILEAVSEQISYTKNPFKLTEYVRSKLARQISFSHISSDGYMPVLMLSPAWEKEFEDNIVVKGDESSLTIAPSKLQEFITKLNKEFDKAVMQGDMPIILVNANIRVHLYQVLKRNKVQITVLSHNEIHAKVKIKTLGQI